MSTNTAKQKQGLLAILLVLAIIVIDQWIKIEVKTNMTLYESREVTPWFYIYFIENNGMAFGMSFINKIVLSLFRCAAIVLLSIYLYRQIYLLRNQLRKKICISNRLQFLGFLRIRLCSKQLVLQCIASIQVCQKYRLNKIKYR